MELTDQQKHFKGALKGMLSEQGNALTFQVLEEKAFQIAPILYPLLSEDEVASVVEAITLESKVEMARGDSIYDRKTFKPWIQERRREVETPRWDAYKRLLIDRDWEINVIEKLDEQTDDVVELMGDPDQTDSNWPRRGLLMGEVQSGKTATYLGILNKAIDYGYRVVIVIGGHTEDLRQQTQARFDTDLLGVDSETLDDGISNAARRYVGVGTLSKLHAQSFTTVRHDFDRRKLGSSVTWVDGSFPTVFITKKNPRLLNNIRDYIKSQAPRGRLDIPLVVVDDESDWGSPNTKDQSDPTSVNKAIRALLDVSTRSTYLAITATPFANIFIDDQAEYLHVEPASANNTEDESTESVLQDLFPSDYIRVMFPPSTYSGINQYFLSEEAGAISTDVDDCLALLPIKHKNHHPVRKLPESMETAIVCFLLGTAVRRLRDEKVKPASMLINVSRFKSVQESVSRLAEEFLQETVGVIRSEFGRRTEKRSNEARRIKEVWSECFSSIRDVAWHEVTQELLSMSSEFRVDLINGDTAKARSKSRKQMTVEQRKQDDMVPKIVVGGDILSRGLTLDGLQVSYFVREPRTMDTLMQMGRWFGFRPNYLDLVRIWMPQSTRDDFAHSAEVVEELRDELHDMKARELTPRDFGLRVRVHPDSVQIVAANKARDTEFVDLGPTVWQSKLVESYDLSESEEVDEGNRVAVENLVSRLSTLPQEPTSGRYTSWQGVPNELIEQFFSEYQGAKSSPVFGRSAGGMLPISDAFQYTPGNDRWSVVLVGSGRGLKDEIADGFAIRRSIRNRMGRHPQDGHIHLDSQRVSSGGDLVNALLSKEKEALEGTRQPDHASGYGKSTQKKALDFISHPMLLLYVVSTSDQSIPPSDSGLLPVAQGLSRIAVAVAFPRMDQDQYEAAAYGSKKYQVNRVFFRASEFTDDRGDDFEELEE